MYEQQQQQVYREQQQQQVLRAAIVLLRLAVASETAVSRVGLGCATAALAEGNRSGKPRVSVFSALAVKRPYDFT